MYVIKVLNKHPKRDSWVGLAMPVARKRQAKVFHAREEADECVKELKSAYGKISAQVQPF